MPTLHDLFDAATDGLPPLPDLAPAAHRIARRRRIATGVGGMAVVAGLAVGAGTVLMSGTGPGVSAPPGGTAIGAAASPTTRPIALARTFPEEAVPALQRIWPIAGERVSYVGKPDQHEYAVKTPTGTYRVILAFYRLPPGDPQNQPHQVCATDTGPASGFACRDLPNGHTVAARVGENSAEFDFTLNDVYFSLNTIGGPMAHIDAHKLLTMAASPVFQQLAADASHYKGVITPMPGAIFPNSASSAGAK